MTADGGRASGGKGTEKSLAGRDITLTLSTFCCPPYSLVDTHKLDEFFFFWCPNTTVELIASRFSTLVSTRNRVRYILQVTGGGRKLKVLIVELATSWRIGMWQPTLSWSNGKGVWGSSEVLSLKIVSLLICQLDRLPLIGRSLLETNRQCLGAHGGLRKGNSHSYFCRYWE